MYIFSGVITGRVNCTSKGRANCSEVLIKLVSNIMSGFLKMVLKNCTPELDFTEL